jgi:hypothetical protein
LAKLIGTASNSSAGMSSALGRVAQRRHLGLQAERRRQLVLVDQLERDQDLAEQPAAVVALLGQRALDRGRGHAEVADQELAEQRRPAGVEREAGLGHGCWPPAGLAGVGLGRRRGRGGRGRRLAVLEAVAGARQLVLDRAGRHRAGVGVERPQDLAVALDVLDLAVDLLDHAALAAVVDVADVLVVIEVAERAQELVALAGLALEDPLQVHLVVDDVRGEQEQQVGLLLVALGVLEQVAEQRDVAEQRHLRLGVRDPVGDQAADDDALLIADDDGGLDLALGPGRAELRVLVADVLDLLLDLEPHHVAGVDDRRDLHRQLDVLALDRQLAEARRPALDLAEAAEVDAALVRDVLADGDLGLLVVGGQDVRARQHVDVGRLGQRLEQHRVRRDAGAEQLLALRQDRADQAADEAGGRGQGRQLQRLEVARLHAAEQQAVLVAAQRQAAVEAGAEVEAAADVELEDDRLDEHLAARHVELAHDVLQRLEVAAARQHDQRVGRRVVGDAHLALERGAAGVAEVLGHRPAGVGGRRGDRCWRRRR